MGGEPPARRGTLMQGVGPLSASAVMLGSYMMAAGDADMQRIFALATVILAVVGTDNLMTGYRERRKNK
jgi:hypothetical protein